MISFTYFNFFCCVVFPFIILLINMIMILISNRKLSERFYAILTVHKFFIENNEAVQLISKKNKFIIHQK